MVSTNCINYFIISLLIGIVYSEDKVPETWTAVLGDICQLPNFPKATADPKRYLECVKQKLSQDRSDIGTWQLRECLEGFEFVASARACKSISTIRRSQSLCNTPNAHKYEYCNDNNNRLYTITETIQAPRKCTCPNGQNNCVCPQPEILTPILATKRMKRESSINGGNSYKITINLPACPCNTEQASCACIDQGLNKVQVFKDTCCQEASQQTTQSSVQACLCNENIPSSTVTQTPFVYTTTPYVQTTSTISNKYYDNTNCQVTTTGELYCPGENQYTYSEPQSCPLVVSGVGNAKYQGICSWMTDPLAVDPESRTHFLQCQPAPKNLYCGRWQRMPCAPATVFDVTVQVCVWETAISGTGTEVGEIPLPQATSTSRPSYINPTITPSYTTSYPSSIYYTTTQATQQYNQCNCNGGIPIGTCNQNYQCPGQSLCQIGVNVETKQNCKFNVILTSIIIFISIYILIVGFFHRSLIHPLNNIETTTESIINENEISEDIQESTIQTIISLFFLWFISLIASKIFRSIYLPALIGCLIVGILFRNMESLKDFLSIDIFWAETIRYAAFVIILIRCGIGLDSISLRSHWLLCGTIGIFSVCIEVIAIVLAAYFIFHIPFALSILLGFTVAAVSPAVTVPAMIDLQEKGRGTENGVPTIVLVSSSIDNLFCITAINLAISIIFHSLSYTLMRAPVEIAVGALVGIILGLILRHLPKSDSSVVHFTRTVLLTTVSFALVYGCKAIYCEIAGPLAVLLMSIVVSMRWKADNNDMTRIEENAYAHVWRLIFEPLLFALIGYNFVISDLNWDIILIGLAVIVIGLVARIIVVFFITIFSHLNLSEKCFTAFCFMPKATVQAALAPIIYQFLLIDFDWNTHAAFFISTCVIAIIITAPLGQIIIRLFGYLLLSKFKLEPYSGKAPSKAYEPHHFMNEINAGLGDNMETVQNEVLNALNGTKHVMPSSVYSAIKPSLPNNVDYHHHKPYIPPSTTFPEINSSSYQEFRERRLAELRNKNEIIRSEYVTESTKQTKF
uniref:Na_H_Exchanger domain-containing protein n=1 Tax=Parastrongyloides trichosuri TaxID=131310 RepID=A0A0N5A726_PARTI